MCRSGGKVDSFRDLTVREGSGVETRQQIVRVAGRDL